MTEIPDISVKDEEYWRKIAYLVDKQCNEMVAMYEGLSRMTANVLTDYLDGKLELRGRPLLTQLRDFARERNEKIKAYKASQKQGENGSPS